MRKFVHLMALATLLPLLGGCLSAGEVSLKRQFLLDPVISAQQAVATPHTLGIRNLTAARPYTLSMLYSDPDGALLPFDGVFWAEQPAVAVTRALRDAIAASGRFADVGDAADMSRPRYVLTGELRAFHEDRSTTPGKARIEVKLAIREARADGQIWSGTVQSDANVDGNTPAAFSKAITLALEDLAASAAASIAQVSLP